MREGNFYFSFLKNKRVNSIMQKRKRRTFTIGHHERTLLKHSQLTASVKLSKYVLIYLNLPDDNMRGMLLICNRKKFLVVKPIECFTQLCELSSSIH